MVRRLLVLSLLLSTASIGFAQQQKKTLRWGENRSVQVVADYPEGAGPFPAVVIASGRGGGMDTPLIRGLAERAVRAGVVAYRFDYAYFKAKGEPSKGQVDEVEEMKQVLLTAKTDPKIDYRRIVLAGKSLGSVVAYRVFAADNELRGAVLLTPVVVSVDDGHRLYPALSGSFRPISIIVGNRDIENAPLGVLYNYLKDASLRVSLNVVAGDHGFNVVDGNNQSDPAQSDTARGVAVDLAVYWIRNMVDNRLPY